MATAAPLVAPEQQRPPPELWGCDPVWSSSVRLLAVHLARLPWAAQGDVCWLGNHPVRSVEIVGIVVELNPRNPREAEERVSLILDDGSGLVECVWFANGSAHHCGQTLGALRIGSMLHVLGKISRFRGERQVTVEQLWLETDPMAECAHWLRARELWQTVYSKPFCIPLGLDRQLRASTEPPVDRDQSVEPIKGHVLEHARALCGGPGETKTGTTAAAIWKRMKEQRQAATAASAPPPVPSLALVKQALDRLVEDGGPHETTLYILSDGPQERLYMAFREVTGLVRPPAGHGCPCVEVVPNLWTAHFHDVDTKDKLTKEAPPVTVVVNAGTDKCDTKPGSYGEGIEVVCIDGLLDDPDQLKKVDGMPEGADKAAARATLPAFEPEMCAGDAYKDFDRVSELITKTGAAGGATLVHCHASLSRSVAFILAHLMKTQSLSAVEAAKLMKSKWDATWPNDTFVKQLLKYEEDLAAAR